MWHKIAIGALYVAGATVLIFLLLIIASKIWKKYKKDRKHLQDIGKVAGASVKIRAGYGEYKKNKYRFFYPSLKHNSLNLKLKAKSPIRLMVVKKGVGEPLFNVLKRVNVNDMELDSEYLFYSSNTDIARRWLKNLVIKNELIGIMNSGCYKLDIQQDCFVVHWKRLSQLELKYLPEWVVEAIDKQIALKELLLDDISRKDFIINPPVRKHFAIFIVSLIFFIIVYVIAQPLDVIYTLIISAVLALPIIAVCQYKIVNFSFRAKKSHLISSILFATFSSILIVSSVVIVANSIFYYPKPKYIKIKKMEISPFFGDICLEIIEFENRYILVSPTPICMESKDNLDVKIYKGRFNIHWVDIDRVATKLSLVDIYSTLESGDINQAVKFANKYIELNPKDIYGYYARGKIYFKLKMYKEALKDILMVLNIDKHQFDAYLMIDEIFSKLKRYKESLKYWNQLIKLEPENGKAYLKRGDVYVNLKKMELAEIDLKKACGLGVDEACLKIKK